ncbi:uncharacterized protein LACBIDRAFT_324466 [Laccaria bicolor S238N-H82]|uniref:Predicted protein n=1 Tax=Laccaria bicolor (strain S238N-H82 / ATCC MYA-4686) TaxID=486041 RepID=B0D1X0_LACBS|nr:uncharacterized protein LACBIDRAFT_324466 [Laccaria bicolor S238N-H82]EDR12065.1 predicted protein [Laccaria bicolor S238N-H82]|eukprot:XP_001877962.1 predicted protein [Laccaria bicolor S238N-H82]
MALGGRLWNLLLCPLFYYVVLFGYVMFAKSFVKQPRQDLSRPMTSPMTTMMTIHHRRQGTRAQQSHRRFDMSAHPPRPLTNGHKCPPSTSGRRRGLTTTRRASNSTKGEEHPSTTLCPRGLTTTRLDSNSTKGEVRPPTTSRVPTTTFDEGRRAPIHDSVSAHHDHRPPTPPPRHRATRCKDDDADDKRWTDNGEDTPRTTSVHTPPPSTKHDGRPLTSSKDNIDT